ncbi:M20 family peptidase [Candidatus Thorarchaeota archaeon]|nr:MAG: M20 family peptidase [Candidatus Thorarchaeota archaeon]
MSSADRSRVLNLAKSLIMTKSENPPGHEHEVASIIRNHLESYGISCKQVGNPKRPNLIFSTSENINGKLLLHGHMDTVPAGSLKEWNMDPFGAVMEGNSLYGRGSCDMKGPLSALAETMILYSQERHKEPLMMLATSEEETTCGGAEAAAKSDLLESVKYGICAEPTSLNVLIGEKGLLWLRLSTKGRAAHGSTPELGKNAIKLCMKALEVILQYDYSFVKNKILGEPTINLGKISGGNKINIVPEECEAELDMRLVKGQIPQEIVNQMNSVLKQHGIEDGVCIDTMRSKPTILTPKDSEIVTMTLDAVENILGSRPPLEAATYGTDCSVLQPKLGIENVICGPGSIKLAHQPNEHINIDELLRAVEIYQSIARNLLD